MASSVSRLCPLRRTRLLSLEFTYYTAVRYHKQLPDELQSKDLLEVLPPAEEFAINTLIPALAKGGFLPMEEKKKIAQKMAYFSGVEAKVILQHNLDLPTRYFWKELLRHEGKNIGRLDSRYLGIDKKETGDAPDYSAELTSWLHSFTPAINHYIRKELKFNTDIKYNMFGPVRPWNNENDNTRDNLRQAMAQNPTSRWWPSRAITTAPPPILQIFAMANGPEWQLRDSFFL